MTSVPTPVSVTSIFTHWFLYAQWYGDTTYTFPGTGTVYSTILLRRAQPFNLSSSLLDQIIKDYHESANITSTVKTKVIDIEFVLTDRRTNETMLRGDSYSVATVTARGDGTYTTFIDSVRFTFIHLDEINIITTLAQEEYVFATPIQQTSNLYTDKVTARMIKRIIAGGIVVNIDDTISLRIEVFGHVDNVLATNNKIRLYHTRGTAETHLYVPVNEIIHGHGN